MKCLRVLGWQDKEGLYLFPFQGSEGLLLVGEGTDLNMAAVIGQAGREPRIEGA
jgi:hypothetical protein